MTPDSNRKAIEFYQQALAKDPNYALAYSGIADCYAVLGSSMGAMRPAEAFPKARSAAEKALVLEGSLSEAHASLGICAFFYDWDWAAAEREFRRSIELNPENPAAHRWYAQLLAATGRLEEAMGEAQRASELDSLSALSAGSAGYILYLCRRYDEAIELMKKVLDLDPNFFGTYAVVVWSYLGKGQLADAIAWAEKPVHLAKFPPSLSFRGMLYGLAGRHNEAMQMMNTLKDISKEQYVSPFHFFVIHFGLGELEAWRKAAMQACEEHSNSVVFFKVSPLFDPIRSDPVFQEIVRQLGLP